MNNIICESEVAYLRSNKVWTFKTSEDLESIIEGGYASFINEMTMILFSQRSIQPQKTTPAEEIDYNKYHFSDEYLKFNREEINER
ncbi:MAG: hypothetical protein ABI325_00325 [Ginsengibacter sp.]